MAVHFRDWYFHILITDGEPVWAEAKMSVFPSNASEETWNDIKNSHTLTHFIKQQM